MPAPLHAPAGASPARWLSDRLTCPFATDLDLGRPGVCWSELIAAATRSFEVRAGAPQRPARGERSAASSVSTARDRGS